MISYRVELYYILKRLVPVSPICIGQARWPFCMLCILVQVVQEQPIHRTWFESDFFVQLKASCMVWKGWFSTFFPFPKTDILVRVSQEPIDLFFVHFISAFTIARQNQILSVAGVQTFAVAR